ncbi:MAG: YgiT-type zinc finger protein [Nitrospirae bacterium]|nr:YgiT-type zinc finger protein [Nitrospirota bacterium]
MRPFDKCPKCSGELVEKTVEKLLKGGSDVAVVKVNASVCLHCGQRLYSKETVLLFEEIRVKLQTRDVDSFHQAGRTFEVACSLSK